MGPLLRRLNGEKTKDNLKVDMHDSGEHVCSAVCHASRVDDPHFV